MNDDELDSFLEHHGVKGMRWGRHSADTSSGSGGSATASLSNPKGAGARVTSAISGANDKRKANRAKYVADLKSGKAKLKGPATVQIKRTHGVVQVKKNHGLNAAEARALETHKARVQAGVGVGLLAVAYGPGLAASGIRKADMGLSAVAAAKRLKDNKATAAAANATIRGLSQHRTAGMRLVNGVWQLAQN